ncbi:type II 3-dehydroquinate dehydratase [Flavobacterium hankyongi]|uniref:3-dehydroquinate dehydratase n=1 Tax=Flavobacterium hankyongi TaxID=1176532 RepID=A0ABP9A6A4_9FLAO
MHFDCSSIFLEKFFLNEEFEEQTQIRRKPLYLLKILIVRILVINGPNLNLLGKREPEVYGNQDFDTFFKTMKSKYLKVNLECFHSNIEGEIINKLQEVGFDYDGIILNAGAYTHTSIGIGDCIKAITTPVVEVHISNTFSRETFRHQSYISPNAKGIIIGFGLQSYELAIQSFL